MTTFKQFLQELYTVGDTDDMDFLTKQRKMAAVARDNPKRAVAMQQKEVTDDNKQTQQALQQKQIPQDVANIDLQINKLRTQMNALLLRKQQLMQKAQQTQQLPQQ